MGYDGSGNFSRAENFTADRDAGIKIRADRMDAEFNNFSVGMNAVLLRSGVAAMTGTLSMGGNAIAGLPDGTAFVPAVRFTSDATTGIYSSGFGKIALAAGSVQRLEANSTGVIVTGTFGVTGAVNMVSNAAVGGTLGVTGVTTLGTANITTGNITTLTLTNPLGTAYGGTGSATVAGARTNLGISATGADTTYAFRANNLSDLGSAPTARTNLGLGTIATQAASAVAITGGTVSGLTTLNMAGNNSATFDAPSGTGVSNVSFAFSGDTFNMGRTGPSYPTTFGWLVANQNYAYISTSWRVGNSGGYVEFTGANMSVSGALTLGTALAVAQGGSGATTAANARTNFGLGTAATQNTGTSGANVPLLNAATNNWSGAANITGQLTLNNTVSDGAVKFLVQGTAKGVRIGTTASAGAIEGVDNSGVGSFQPMIVNGSNVTIQQSGTNVAVFSSTGMALTGIVSSTGNNSFPGTASGTAYVYHNNVNGAILYGDGSTNDVLIANKAGTAVMSIPTGGTATAFGGNITVSGTMNATTAAQENGVDLGYKNLVSQTGGLVAGKLFVTSAGFTVNTGAAADTTYMVYNDSGVAITLTQGAGLTMRLAGTTSTGSRTLAPRGFATLWNKSTTEVVVNGNVT